MYIRNRTPTDVLGGKAPLEVWESKPLGSMKHMHEWGALAFKHIEVRQRNGKLTPRAKKIYLVGYNTHNMTCRLWNPDRPYEITNSAEASIREKKVRDVVRPKVGHDPFPDSSTAFVPGVETGIEAKEIQRQEPAKKGSESTGTTETTAQKQQAARYIARQ